MSPLLPYHLRVRRTAPDSFVSPFHGTLPHDPPRHFSPRFHPPAPFLDRLRLSAPRVDQTHTLDTSSAREAPGCARGYPSCVACPIGWNASPVVPVHPTHQPRAQPLIKLVISSIGPPSLYVEGVPHSQAFSLSVVVVPIPPPRRPSTDRRGSGSRLFRTSRDQRHLRQSGGSSDPDEFGQRKAAQQGPRLGRHRSLARSLEQGAVS